MSGIEATDTADGSESSMPALVNIASLDSDAKETMARLSESGDAMTDFAREYKRIWTVIQAAHRSQAKTMETARTAAAQIDDQKALARDAQTTENELKQTRMELESEVSKLSEEESKARKSISEKNAKLADLKSSIARLQLSLDAGPGWTDEQKKARKELQDQLNGVRAHAEAKRTNLSVLRRDLATLQEHVDRVEGEMATIEKEKADVRAEIEAVVAKTSRLTKAKEAKDTEIKSLQAEIDSLHLELVDRQSSLKNADTSEMKQQAALKTRVAETERLVAQYGKIHKQTVKLTDELDRQIVTNEAVATELNDTEARSKAHREEARYLKKQASQKRQLHDAAKQKLEKIDAEDEKVEEEKAKIQAQLRDVQADARAEEVANMQAQRAVDDLKKERQVLEKTLVEASNRTAHAETLTKVQMSVRKTVENEISGYRGDVQRLRDTIEDLHAECAKTADACHALEAHCQSVREQIRLQDLQVATLQRKLAEGDTRLKKQQAMYDAVRKERNQYSKTLVELEEEIAAIQRDFKMKTTEIEMCKDEITTKDHRLVKEHFGHHRVEKEKEGLRTELTRLKRQIQTAEDIGNSQEAEIKKLSQVLHEADEERTRQQKELTSVIAERDLLRAQLMKREDELTALYEKLKLQRGFLDKGGNRFVELKTTEASLVDQIGKLRAELQASKSQISSVDDLKKEVFKLERELTHEAAKVKALQEETGRPLNVHRWRKLEGSQPKLYAMILRVQSMQKRLIQAHEDLMNRDLLIQEKEKLYVQLKNILARQPGPEVAEQLTVYQQNLKEKQKQLRAMELELEMHKGEVRDYKYEIEKLNADASTIQSRFLKRARGLHSRSWRGGAPTAGGIASYDPTSGGPAPTAEDYMAGNLWDQAEAAGDTLDASEAPASGAAGEVPDAAAFSEAPEASEKLAASGDPALGPSATGAS